MEEKITETVRLEDVDRREENLRNNA